MDANLMCGGMGYDSNASPPPLLHSSEILSDANRYGPRFRDRIQENMMAFKNLPLINGLNIYRDIIRQTY
jgi:hypothetical protein